MTTLGDKTGVETILHALAKKRGISVKEMANAAHTFAGFFKHADRKPTGRISFADSDVDHVLMMACHDFGRLTSGMPVEAQIYEAWCVSLAFARVSDAPLRRQALIKAAIEMFPGIRRADRKIQKQLGLNALNRMQSDPELQMTYGREVAIAVDQSSNEKLSVAMKAAKDPPS